MVTNTHSRQKRRLNHSCLVFFFIDCPFFSQLYKMNVLTPPLHRGMMEIERSAFKKVISTFVIKVPTKSVGIFMKTFDQ